MALKLFNGADTSLIHNALFRDCSPNQVISVHFRAQVPPVRSVDRSEQWLRLRGILGCAEVSDQIGTRSLSIDPPAAFHYATGFETIGTIANLLIRGGIHRKFVDSPNDALTIARRYLDAALLRQYHSVEAYSSREPWCDWFAGERVLDETVLLGNLDEWWLLAVTGTD